MNSWCTSLEYSFISTRPSIRSSTISSRPNIGRPSKKLYQILLVAGKHKICRVFLIVGAPFWVRLTRPLHDSPVSAHQLSELDLTAHRTIILFHLNPFSCGFKFVNLYILCSLVFRSRNAIYQCAMYLSDRVNANLT